MGFAEADGGRRGGGAAVPVSSLWPRMARSQTMYRHADMLYDNRPVKTNIVQSYHVTTDDLDASSTQPTDDDHPPVIPQRTTSLHSHRHTSSWASHERRAGSLKFNTVPTLTRTPWEVARSERPGSSRWSRSSDRPRSVFSRRHFAQLPQEVYQCIVDHVETVHTTTAGVDISGIRHDLLSLSRTNRYWLKIAREQLYRHLWLPNNRVPAKKKWSRQQPKSKLRLLHDTLRNNPGLAFHVHRISFNLEVADEILAQAYLPYKRDSVLNLVRDVVRQCYNLERVCGNVVPLTSSTLPFFEALATRSRLKEHAWSLDSVHAELPDLDDLIRCHDQWLNLDTLVLTADLGVDFGRIAISAILNRLPSLKHLMISGLHATDFSNATMLILPALKSLRLENLEGVSDRGVEQLAFTRLAPSLERLKLVGLELVSLQTISTLLSHLTRMQELTLVQDTSPEAQTGVKFVGKGTSFGSSSLRRLHWDCLIPGSAIPLFAEGIEGGRFTSLRQVCVPCDYDGVIQALCRPLPRTKLIQADLDYLESRSYQYQRDLRVSQIQAQLRIRFSKQQPSFNVIVQDELNEVQRTHVFGTYLGEMSSQIDYCLEAEAGNKALAGFDDVAWPKRYAVPGIEQQHGLSVLF